MGSELLLKKYILKQEANSVLSVDLDLSGYSFGNFKQAFLEDFLSLDLFLKDYSESEMHFSLGQDIIQIKKNHTNRTIEFYLNGVVQQKDFFSFLSEKFSQNIDSKFWKLRVLDLAGVSEDESIKKIKALSLMGGSEGDLLNGIPEEQKSQILKIVDTKKKIRNLQEKVEAFQNKKSENEDLERQISSLETKLTALNEKKSSVTKLIQDKKEVEQKMLEVKNSSASVVSDIERQQTLRNRVAEMKGNEKKSLTLASKNVRVERRTFRGAFLIPLLIMQVVLSFLIFLTSEDLVVLVAGLFSFLVIIITAVILNFSDREDLDFELSSDFVASNQSPNINNPSEKFVNSAIINALNIELQSINSSISQNLAGMSYEELEKQTLQATTELNDLESKADSSEVLSPEEYYKARRELDILKIDEENIQFSKDSSVDMKLVEQLLSQEREISQLGIPVVLLNAQPSISKQFKSIILVQ